MILLIVLIILFAISLGDTALRNPMMSDRLVLYAAGAAALHQFYPEMPYKLVFTLPLAAILVYEVISIPRIGYIAMKCVMGAVYGFIAIEEFAETIDKYVKIPYWETCVLLGGIVGLLFTVPAIKNEIECIQFESIDGHSEFTGHKEYSLFHNVYRVIVNTCAETKAMFEAAKKQSETAKENKNKD